VVLFACFVGTHRSLHILGVCQFFIIDIEHISLHLNLFPFKGAVSFDVCSCPSGKHPPQTKNQRKIKRKMRFHIQPTLNLLANVSSLFLAGNIILGNPVSAGSTTTTAASSTSSSTSLTIPTPSEIDPARSSAWPSPGRPTHRPTSWPNPNNNPVPPDGAGLPDDFHGYLSGRFCPWCWAFVKPRNFTDECNFVIQQMAGAYRPGKVERGPMPWAVLDYNFSRVLDAGVARRDEFVGITLKGENENENEGENEKGGGEGRGYVQYVGNGFLVSTEGGILP